MTAWEVYPKALGPALPCITPDLHPGTTLHAYIAPVTLQLICLDSSISYPTATFTL